MFAVGGALDLHRGEEPAIESFSLAAVLRILLGDAQRLAVLVVVGGPPVRGHGVVVRLAAVGVGAAEELVRRKRPQAVKVCTGPVVRQVYPSLHRDTVAILGKSVCVSQIPLSRAAAPLTSLARACTTRAPPPTTAHHNDKHTMAQHSNTKGVTGNGTVILPGLHTHSLQVETKNQSREEVKDAPRRAACLAHRYLTVTTVL